MSHTHITHQRNEHKNIINSESVHHIPPNMKTKYYRYYRDGKKDGNDDYNLVRYTVIEPLRDTCHRYLLIVGSQGQGQLLVSICLIEVQEKVTKGNL